MIKLARIPQLLILCVAFALIAFVSLPRSSSSPSFDVLIKNGRILDSSRNPWYAADIGTRGDRIDAIEN